MTQGMKDEDIQYCVIDRRFAHLQQEVNRILRPLPQAQVIIDRRVRGRRRQYGPVATNRRKRIDRRARETADFGGQMPQTYLPDHAIDRMVVTVLCQMDGGSAFPKSLKVRASRYILVSPLQDNEQVVAWWESVDGKKVRINNHPLISLKRTG